MNSSLNASKIIIDEDVKSEISEDEAEKAVKILIEYIGEDPNREGLLETPKRVIKSFKELILTLIFTCVFLIGIGFGISHGWFIGGLRKKGDFSFVL